MQSHYSHHYGTRKPREVVEAARQRVILDKLATGSTYIDGLAREGLWSEINVECQKHGCRHPKECADRIVATFDTKMRDERLRNTQTTIFVDTKRKKKYHPLIVDMKSTRERALKDAKRLYHDAPICEY